MSTTEALAKADDLPPVENEYPLLPGERQNRLGRLLELAKELLDQVEQLRINHCFTRSLQYPHSVLFSEPINFYAEVEKFEIGLITLTLSKTGGNKRRAARLLNLKSSTLHEIIKRYRIAV